MNFVGLDYKSEAAERADLDGKDVFAGGWDVRGPRQKASDFRKKS